MNEIKTFLVKNS